MHNQFANVNRGRPACLSSPTITSSSLPCITCTTRRSAASAASVRARPACRRPAFIQGCEPSLFGKKAMRMDSPTVPPHASVSKTHAAFRSGQVRAARGGGRAWACRRGTRRCARLWRACRGVAHMAPGCAALSPVPIRRAKCWGAASPFPCPPRAGATCRREWRSDGSGGERSYQMCANNFARQARATAPRGHALRCMCPMTVVVAGAGREWGSEAPCVYARL